MQSSHSNMEKPSKSTNCGFPDNGKILRFAHREECESARITVQDGLLRRQVGGLGSHGKKVSSRRPGLNGRPVIGSALKLASPIPTSVSRRKHWRSLSSRQEQMKHSGSGRAGYGAGDPDCMGNQRFTNGDSEKLALMLRFYCFYALLLLRLPARVIHTS